MYFDHIHPYQLLPDPPLPLYYPLCPLLFINDPSSTICPALILFCLFVCLFVCFGLVLIFFLIQGFSVVLKPVLELALVAYVAYAGLKFTEICLPLQRLKACATTTQHPLYFSLWDYPLELGWFTRRHALKTDFSFPRSHQLSNDLSAEVETCESPALFLTWNPDCLDFVLVLCNQPGMLWARVQLYCHVQRTVCCCIASVFLTPSPYLLLVPSSNMVSEPWGILARPP